QVLARELGRRRDLVRLDPPDAVARAAGALEPAGGLLDLEEAALDVEDDLGRGVVQAAVLGVALELRREDEAVAEAALAQQPLPHAVAVEPRLAERDRPREARQHGLEQGEDLLEDLALALGELVLELLHLGRELGEPLEGAEERVEQLGRLRRRLHVRLGDTGFEPLTSW